MPKPKMDELFPSPRKRKRKLTRLRAAPHARPWTPPPFGTVMSTWTGDGKGGYTGVWYIRND